jgi:hypothetical protein
MAWPRFSSGKGPPVPTAQEAGWAPELVWTQRLEEKSFASAAIKPRSPGNPVCSQTLYWLSDPGSQIKMHHLQEKRYEHFLGLALQVCFIFATSFSSLWWWKQFVSLKCQSTSTKLHGTTSQISVIFKINYICSLLHPMIRVLPLYNYWHITKSLKRCPFLKTFYI